MWAEHRARLEAVVARVVERAAAAGFAVAADVDPAEEPGPRVVWNWHITFTAGPVDVDVMAAQDLSGFAVEDEGGRLEIPTDAEGLPGAVVGRLAGR